MASAKRWKFTRPEVLELVDHPTLTVDVFITCRNGQEKLDLVLAALSMQNYPENLTHIHVIDDGSSPKLVLPPTRPSNSTLHFYENEGKNWGKPKSTNFFAQKSKADVIWFLDADMIVEPSHLSHHMKWHHQATDFVVLGYKKFVKDWNYDPQSLVTTLKNGNFQKIHSDFYPDIWWDTIIDTSNQLRSDDLKSYRALVGATFSISTQNWLSLEGYDENMIFGQDTELGWRCMLQGLRFVPEQDAQSWHLGLTTNQKNSEVVQNHNKPLVANRIPGYKHVRQDSALVFDVPENEFLIDCRFITLVAFFEFIRPLLNGSQKQSKFRLLANWPKLVNRYSPTDDEYRDLRGIQKWCENDQRFSFETLDAVSSLSMDQILQLIQVRSTPFYFFAEGKLLSRINVKRLKKSLVRSGNGLEGILDDDDQRFFACYAPAISTAKRASGSTYKNIEECWGMCWNNLPASNVPALKKSRKLLPVTFLLRVRHFIRVLATVQSFYEFRYLFRRRLKIAMDKLFQQS